MDELRLSHFPALRSRIGLATPCGAARPAAFSDTIRVLPHKLTLQDIHS
ncbi:hypothetical protein PTE31013_02154 [Pandoraea terrigena]|uniref:Uncharacterized protein n=1 Tax=Pandoraea terrigena TaxID=2508292 RepID=A0A5E4UP05_9BURK|nr:hypothetical protein PTE31013_02154 [Pandoraea terrigena]